jgi:uncharacterized protein (DUF924 family)
VAEFLQIVTGFSQMPVKLLSESMAASITDDDARRIDEILSFWFKEQELSAPQIDRRMDIWFGENPDFDDEVEAKFSDDVAGASTGKLDHWAEDPRGRLALIILIDQFRRNIYRNTEKAFSRDRLALKLCVEGAMEKKDKSLTPIQKVFFYMPLQHTESLFLHAIAAHGITQGTDQIRGTVQPPGGVRLAYVQGDLPDGRAVRRIAQGHHRSVRPFSTSERVAGPGEYTGRGQVSRRRQP